MRALDVLALLGALAQSILVGYLAVQPFWPRIEGVERLFGVRLALSFGCGVGLSAAAYLLLYFFATAYTGWCFALEFLLGAFLWRIARRPRETASPPVALPEPAKTHRGLFLLVLFFLANLLIRFVTQSLYEPLGGIDAFTMWNLRARYLFLLQDNWVPAFDRSFNTPDYPLLLPAFIARAWKAIGDPSPLGPSVIALLFTLAVILCLFSAVRILRGGNQACLAVIGLLSAPTFMNQAATQYADIEMAYFMCAAVTTACIWRTLTPSKTRLLALTGLLAGLAAWTKNEGTLFALTLAVALAIVGWQSNGLSSVWRDLRLYVSGLAIPMAALVYFKTFVVPPSEFVQAQTGWGAMMEMLLDPARHAHLWRTAAGLSVYFWLWPSILPVLVILGLCAGLQVKPGQWGTVAIPALVLIQSCLGYYAMCLITPHEYRMYIDMSAYRYLVQLWPLIMLLAFLMIKPLPWRRQTDS